VHCVEGIVALYQTRRLVQTLALVASLLDVGFAVAEPVMGYKVVAMYPHSTENYTEGFFYLDGLFCEGTGLNGHSAIVVTQPKTGKTERRRDMPSQYFGEGIVDWGPNLIEWTWQSHVGFVLDRFSLKIVRQFHYDGEGWGMARTAITSDGTAILRFCSPDTFDETHHIVVRDGQKLIDQLNELEYIKGDIYAHRSDCAYIAERRACDRVDRPYWVASC
jgi:glutamine cyclotransferase